MGSVFFKSGTETLQTATKTFFDLQANDIDGKLYKFDQLKQKKAIIVVNVACKCGYTGGHYQELVQIYKDYKDKGLEILGFPCNQFMSQEPKPEPEIKDFVQKEYGASFPLFSKINVNGPDTHEVYKWLRLNSSLSADGKSKEIPWNFGKFLLNSEGKVIGFYPPNITPNELLPQIKALL